MQGIFAGGSWGLLDEWDCEGGEDGKMEFIS